MLHAKRVAMSEQVARPIWLWLTAPVAVLFGVVTIGVGGRTLFGPSTGEPGIVPFVLWFNFLAGFAYVAAGAGLFWRKRAAAVLAALIAAATIVVFIAFGAHVVAGGAFMPRTVGAMALRSIVWILIAVVACRALGCRSRPTS
jgi:hypothetical protein